MGGVTKHVTKHRNGPKHRSFHNLLMQISNIFQQPAGVVMLTCIKPPAASSK